MNIYYSTKNRMVRSIRTALPLLVVFICAATVLTQKPFVESAPSADRLREVISYLASDALEGRRTGSPGANDAARYISGEFQRLGLQPGSPVTRGTRLKGEMLARFQQRFPYVAGVELGKNNLFSVNGDRPDDSAPLVVGEDWIPLGFSSRGEIKNAPYSFVGYGITAAEQNYDSYAGLNVKDAVAVALSGTPDGDNPHGQFGRYEDVHWKAIAARNAGAKALLVIAQDEKFKDDRLTRLRYDNSAGEAGLPVAVISRQVAGKLFSTHGDLFSALVEATKPRPKEDARPPSGRTTAGFLLMKVGVTLSLSIDITRHEVAASNIVGILEGSDPQLKNEAIVIGAHYDHLGRGGEGSLAPREGEIHHGADDNASGVAGLLELARIFSSQQPRPKRSIVFIAFSGEEEGLLGSNYYVNHPVVPLANVAAMINMDMIGRLKDNKLIVGGVGTATEWRGWLGRANPPVGMTAVMRRPTNTDDRSAPGESSANLIKDLSLTLNEDGYGPSDHSSFYTKQVPVLFFFTGSHADYHKPSDTADKINYEGEARIVALIARVVRLVDQNDKRPSYTVAKSDSTGRATGFRVYLGTIPNYAEANDGLLLDGVRDDSPASKAGLKAGDKIVKLAGRDVRNVYDYTYALGEMKAGQEYEIELMRGSERLKLKITPAARK
jgi:aminopeptidase YwaD